MNKTHIQWTNFTSNPLQYRDADGNVVWGCIHKSTGCEHCYAEALAKRYGRGESFTAEHMKKMTPFLDEKELHRMLTYKPASGKMCFVGDMTDIFGEWVPFELLDKLFAVFALRPDVIWQILTKRPERMREYMTLLSKSIQPLERHAREVGYTFAFNKISLLPWPIPNVWLGVSCEDQKTADERIPKLLQTPAAVRFVSYEPALAPADFLKWLREPCRDTATHTCNNSIHRESGARINWLIIGGESGPGARPADRRWFYDALKQCKEAGVPAFCKQLGTQSHIDNNGSFLPLKDRKGGDWSEWPEDLRVREFPA